MNATERSVGQYKTMVSAEKRSKQLEKKIDSKTENTPDATVKGTVLVA